MYSTLGFDDDRVVDDFDVRRCFNCGSPEHILADCPERRNRELIALTRQLYDFYKGSSSGPSKRIHEVEQWKKQRLEWLEMFEPGRIQGRELRDALGIPDGDVGEYVPWLRNIADFGYPKGWIAEEDPRIRVWRRIVQDGDEPDPRVEEQCEFSIHGDTDETLTLSGETGRASREVDECSESSEDTSSSVEEGEISEPSSAIGVRRWAAYPETYFSNSRLFVYSPPPPQPDLDPLDALMASYDKTTHGQWADFAQFAMPFLQTSPPPQPRSSPPPPPPGSPPPLPPRCSPPPLPQSRPSSPPLRSQSASARSHEPLAPPPLLLPSPSPMPHPCPTNAIGDPGSDMELSDSD